MYNTKTNYSLILPQGCKPCGARRKFVSGDHYKHGYQGQFTEKDEEVNWDAFELRNWDGRLARWTSIDPANQFWSPYLGMGNDPVNLFDPDGAKVAYNGFGDWVRVQFGRLFSSEFNQKFKGLRGQSETYTFNRVDGDGFISADLNGNGALTGDFTINYNFGSNTERPIGKSPFHALFEETFHAHDFAIDKISGIHLRTSTLDLGFSTLTDKKLGESLAWKFAADNAPFAKVGGYLWDNNERLVVKETIISRIRNTNKNNIQKITNILFERQTFQTTKPFHSGTRPIYIGPIYP